MQTVSCARRIALVLILACLSLPAMAATAGLGEQLATHMSALEAYGFSGTLLVAKGGQVIHHGAYGFADADRKVPFTMDTAFDIGSITKQFTAAAILKLETQGKLSVQDPVSRWFEGVPEDKRSMTLHHLLTHSSGLRGDFGGDYEEMPRDRLVKMALESKLQWAPGTRYDYSNAGYSLLAAVVELASGQPYEVYLKENLWKPAGMTRTGYRLLEKGPLAHGVRDGKDWGTPVDKVWAPEGPWWNLRGNGGVLSTTGDLYKWHQALEGEAILSKEAKAKIFTPHMPEDEEGSSHYGYGWAILKTPRGTRLISHNGGNGIFHADFRRYVDEGIVLIIGSNRADFASIPAVGPISRLIFNSDYSAPPEVAKVDPSVPRRVAGTYVLPTGGKLKVAAAESPSGWPGVTVTPEGKDAFLVLAGGGTAGNEEREARVMAALEKSLKGDFAPLAEVYGAPLAEVEEMTKRARARMEEQHGPFREIRLLGTVLQGGRPATWVEVRHERGSSWLELLWSGEIVSFVRTRDSPAGISVFLPEKTGQRFASYEPRTGTVLRVDFMPDGLTLGKAEAKREKETPAGR